MSDRVPLSEVIAVEESSTQPDRVPNRTEYSGDYLADTPDYFAASTFFDLDHSDRRTPDMLNQVDYLVQYAREVTGSDSIEDALLHLKSLQRFMGLSEKGTGLVKKMHRWAKLDSKRKSLDKEMQLIHE